MANFSILVGEEWTQILDMTGKLPPGTIIESATVTAAISPSGTDASGDVLGGSVIILEGSKVAYVVIGYEAGKTYELLVTMALADDKGTLKKQIRMSVVARL